MIVNRIEVLQKIYSYLQGEIDLPLFRNWIVGAQIDSEANGDDRAKRMLWEIEAYYAELSDGHVSEAVWKKTIERLANRTRLNL